MRRSYWNLWCKLMIAALALPLLEISCVEVAHRASINGFFDAVTPLIDEGFEDRVTDFFEAGGEP